MECVTCLSVCLTLVCELTLCVCYLRVCVASISVDYLSVCVNYCRAHRSVSENYRPCACVLPTDV